MKSKLWKRIVGAGVVLVGGFGAYLGIAYANLETYTFHSTPQLLTDSEGAEYENLHEDFLKYVPIDTGKKIGKVEPQGAVYEIEGQEDHDWIYMADGAEMGIQEVRVRKGTKAILLKDLKPEQIEIVNNTGFHKSLGASTDMDVMDEVMTTLLGGKGKIIRDFEGEINDLWIEDPRMKGIAYNAAVLVTKDKHVYVGELNMNVWHEVTGPAKKWIQDVVN